MENDFGLLARALAQFDIASFVKKHGGHKESLYSRQQEYLLPCPLCASTRLRFNAEKQTWICWTCKQTGGTLRLIALLQKCNEMEAIDVVMGTYVGGDASTAPLAGVATRVARNPLRKLPPIPWPDGVDVIDPAHPAHAKAMTYLATRGIDGATALAYRLGYARTGKLRERIVFPCWMQGSLVYWQARAMWDPPFGLSSEDRRKWIADTSYRKTLNPIARSEEDAGAGEVLFNLDGVQGRETVVVVEGPVDAIKVGPAAVALFGKGRSPSKVARLQRVRGCTQIILYLDRDAQSEAYALAAELASVVRVGLAVPPEGYDPGALHPTQNEWVLRQAVPFSPTKPLVGL